MLHIIVSFIIGLLVGVYVHIHKKVPEIMQRIFNIIEALTSIIMFLALITRGEILQYIYYTGIDAILGFFLGTLAAASLGNSKLI